MDMCGDHTMPILPVMKVDAVPDWLSSLIARRCWCGVLLRFDMGVGKDARLREWGSHFEHGTCPKLVQLAEAKTHVVDDAFVIPAPLAQVCGGLLNGLEANILAKLGVDDPLLHHRFGLLEAVVNVVVNLSEATLQELLLLGQLLLDDSLLDGELADFFEQKFRIGVHIGGGGYCALLGATSIVVADRRFRWKWRRRRGSSGI
jgi:hypothetical protein